MEPLSPEYCFLTIQHWSTCMTKAEWSGWMQAIFSVLAIGAAVTIPWKQRHTDRRERRRSEHEICLIASAEIGPMLPNALQVVQSIKEGIASVTAENAHERVMRYLYMVEMTAFPNEQQLLRLQPMLPKTASSLAIACTLFQQLRMGLALIHNRREATGEFVSAQVRELTDLCEHVRLCVAESRKNIDGFVRQR